MYNPVTRSVEAELFPALRKFGMRFDAYNPLAGGILTGKHKFSDKSDGKIQPGRFEGNSWAATYQKRFWSDSMFNTVDMVQKALDKVSVNWCNLMIKPCLIIEFLCIYCTL